MRESGYRLILGALLWTAAVRAQTPAPHPAAPAAAAPTQAAPVQAVPPGHPQTAAAPASQDVPDAEFIEFLGEDDHGDADWSEFLKRAQHGAQNPAPPQGAKQS